MPVRTGCGIQTIALNGGFQPFRTQMPLNAYPVILQREMSQER